eukprot:853148_1
MTDVKAMRKDPACLLSRVLHEISSTVCVQVSSDELNDFGVIKQEKDSLKPNERPKRDKMTFVVEETKENHVMCEKTKTKCVDVHYYPSSRDAPSDTFIVNGANLSLYMRLFPQQPRTIHEAKTKRCCTEEELGAFFKELDSKYIISWQHEVSHKCRYIACNAIIPNQYDTFQTNGKQLKQQKIAELKDAKLKSEAKSILVHRNDEIKQEFFNLYVAANGDVQIELINGYYSRLSMGNELAENCEKAMIYLTMETRQTSLPKQDYMSVSWGKEKVDALVDRSNQLLTKCQEDIEHSEKSFRETMGTIEKKQKPKPQGMTAKMWSGFKNVLGLDDGEDAKHVKLTDEQWNQYKEELKSNARCVKEIAITFCKNAMIENWCDAFAECLDQYKRKVYKKNKSGSIIHFTTVKNAIKSSVFDKYRKLQRDLDTQLFRDFRHAQQHKKDSKTATLKYLNYTPKNWSNALQYELRYSVPKRMPPTYDLEYTYVDLPSINAQMKRNELKNMHYEMPQDDELLFHHVMANGDAIMFVCGDNDEHKTSETTIIVSNRMVLYPGNSLDTLKKRVLSVAFCESQKTFAILFEDRLAFAVLQENIRVAFNNKGCDLTRMAWYNHRMQFKVMLIHEVDKNLFVWFVDQNNHVRAFDVDTNDWDAAKVTNSISICC